LKLTVPVKLITDGLQSQALYNTLVEANRACDYIAQVAWEHKCFSQIPLHKLCYHDVRSKFNLAAQIVIRCIAKVVQAYLLDKKVQRKFRPDGSIAFDARNLTIRAEKRYVTIWTQLGRIKIPFTAGQRQLAQLTDKVGECDLIHRKNQWYLHCSVETPELLLQSSTSILGVDLGIKNIAVTSNNTCYSGSQVNKLRKRHANLRRKLQSKGTRSAKRLLCKHSKREHRFVTNQNHIISKRIVQEAQCTNSSIALENLKGITRRTKVRKPQRTALAGWTFYQLRTFIEYKARLAGVEFMLVNPAHTSQTCPECGFESRYNRRDRDHFCCKQCGHADHADYVAARNIAAKAVLSLAAAAVNQPNVAGSEA
jgi:putative transposase